MMPLPPPPEEPVGTATAASPKKKATATAIKVKVPSQGPEPTLLNRKQIDALYETLDAITTALKQLDVQYIITGGSLLGAIRQHSILFCDDDIDVTIIETSSSSTGSVYDKVWTNLPLLLGKEYIYSKRPWEGGDKVRPVRMSNVFVDIFTLREYKCMEELTEVIGKKRNGQDQSEDYVRHIVNQIEESTFLQGGGGEDADAKGNKNTEDLSGSSFLCPFWHFNERKAIEMWPKEVYRTNELFPLCQDLKFGPLTGICGPRMPVMLLKRAFGSDCFDVYYQSGSHQTTNNIKQKKKKKKKDVNAADTTCTSACSDNERTTSTSADENDVNVTTELKPIVQEGGNWSNAKKVPLLEEHYLPMQPISRAKRRYTAHNKEQLLKYLDDQSQLEKLWIKEKEQEHSHSFENFK